MKIQLIIRKLNILGLSVLIALAGSCPLMAQMAGGASDSTGKPGEVQIIHSDRVGIKQAKDSAQIKFASGHVEIRQNSTLFYCDSVAINSVTRILEAFGHVHINDNDSVNIYADFMRYRGGERKAFMKNNVKLTDGNGTLYTSELDYDLNTKIAVYSHNGRLVNGKSVLTSVSGTYYGDTRDAEFHNHVKLVDPDYVMTTDTLLYNTVTKIATFTVPTLIKMDKKRSIQTSDGYYDLIHKSTYLGKRPTIIDSSSILIADEVAAEDSSGFAEARGNVVFKDTAQGMVILCNDLKSNRESASFLATVNPVAIIKQGTDSIFIAADTLYSAKFPDSTGVGTDSIGVDSTRQLSADSTVGAHVDSAFDAVDSLQAMHTPLADSSQKMASAADSSAQIQKNPPSKGFHKEGKVFVWDNNTTDTTGQQQKALQEEKTKKGGLFGIFKKRDKDKGQDKSKGNEQQEAQEKRQKVKVDSASVDTVLKDSLPSPEVKQVPHKLEPKPEKQPEKHKKSIFSIFKKKDADAGKRQPSIIDSAREGKARPEFDSTGNPIERTVKGPADSTDTRSDSAREKDNKNRFLEAYYNVRIYSDSLQGIGDSLYYSARDSLMQLFKEPTVWTTSNNQISQISGDTINMQIANNRPEYIRVADDAIMISQADTLHQKKTSEFFNQMSGNKMEVWFNQGQLDSLSAEGNAQGIFYGLDEENKYIGVTQQKSRVLSFYFLNRALERVVGKKDVVGRVYPMREVDHEKIRLKGFSWLDEKRPKSKYELFAH